MKKNLIWSAVIVGINLLTSANIQAAPGWEELSNTQLKSVCPANTGVYAFADRCNTVITAWNGGVADTKRNRLIIWGGGHDDYYGNELYSLNLGSSPATLTRLTDPSPINTSVSACPAELADGKPNSRHTNNSLAYIEHLDRMFVFSGALACPNGQNARDTWTLDMNSLQWQRMDPVNGSSLSAAYGPHYSVAAYDPNSKSVLLNWSDIMWRYTYETNTYTRLGTAHVPFSATGVIDPKRKLFIFMGTEYQSTVPKVIAIDISSNSSFAAQDWSAQVSGCAPLAGSNYPGLTYDAALDRIVGWPNAGNTAYVFNPDTKSCNAPTFTGGPKNPILSNGSGTFGRFRYFPALNAHAVVSQWDMNAYVLRLSGDGGASVPAPPPPPPPTVSLTAPANSSTVSGTVAVSANAAADAGLAGVQFKLDGVDLGAEDTTAPYTVTWNSAATENGTRVLTAVARDLAGQTTTSATVIVTVNNAIPSTSPLSNISGNTGMGKSTITCIDKDGDRKGVGPGCEAPDADDTDAAVGTGAEALAKHGTMAAFLRHLGYNPTRIWYVSPTGNDTTGQADNVNLPFKTYYKVSLSLKPGEVVMFRGGRWTERVNALSGVDGNPIVYMSYPGELATFDGPSAGIGIVNISNITVDGVKTINSSCMSGGTSDENASSKFHDNTFRHIEASYCQWGFSAFNGLVNLVLEESVFHHNTNNSAEHGIYLGSRGLVSSNVTVRRNLIYHNDWTGFQFNGRVNNLVTEQNVIYSNLLSGISLEMGVSDSFIRNNLLFANGRAGVIITNYDGNCYPVKPAQAPICPYDQSHNVIENNTVYNTGKDRDGLEATGQAAFQVANSSTGKIGDLGHNIFRNNIAVSWGGNDHYPPVVFNDGEKDYLRTSTFTNNIYYQSDGMNGTAVIGFGPGSSWGFAPYTCATAQSVTNITGCIVADPKLVSASTAFWNSPVSFDLRLQAGSPAIGAGAPLSEPRYDVVGSLYAATPTIGAYEFSPGTPGPSAGTSACDINGDGAINSTDVQQASLQALGTTACGTADVQKNGQCNVVDVQRVINAASGSACIVGP